jgi:hypothetical protein
MTATSCANEVKKACAATKCHKLLTARIIRFCEAAKDTLGLETEVAFNHSEIDLALDQESNIKRGIQTYSISVRPGACRTAILLNKLSSPTGKASGAFVFHIYDPVKKWPRPTDEAFAELLALIKSPGVAAS